MKRALLQAARTLALGMVVALVLDRTSSAEIVGLGFVPASLAESGIAISADGTTVVSSMNTGGLPQAVRWTSTGAVVGLGYLPGASVSFAYATSADGGVVVGYSSLPQQAFRWTPSGGMVGLGFLPGKSTSAAFGVSADGSVVVGYSGSGPTNTDEAFRWTQATGMVSLGFLPGGGRSVATATSSDGSVIVGYSGVPGFDQAFRWTQAGGMVGLGFLSGGTYSIANAVSGDGKVVVGHADAAGTQQAFRWTQATGMVGLGYLPGHPLSIATATNATGSVVVGFSGNRAFVWTPSIGMQSLETVARINGVSVSGWTLQRAYGVSADGTTIVGFGIDPSGAPDTWLLRLGSGFLTSRSAAQSFASLQGVVESGHGLINAGLGALVEIAAHHGCTGICFNAYGLSSLEKGPSFDDPAYVGTVGLAKRLWGNLSVGFTAGIGTHHNDLANGSKEKGRTQSVGVHAGFTPDQGPQFLAGALISRVWSTIERAYLNGDSPVTSTGHTNGTGNGAVVRLGWAARVFAPLRVLPFADYEVTRVRYSGWTEIYGPFPAMFEAIDDTQQRTRVGVEARYWLSPASYVWGTAAWGHRLTGTTAPISGQLIDLFGLTVAGSPVTRNWTESSAGIRYAFTPTAVVTTSIGARLGGGNSTITNVRTGLSIKF